MERVEEYTTREWARRAKRLWVAVLHQAIEDAKGRSTFDDASGNPGIQRDALTWIFHDRSRAANSFHAICDLLAIDPDWARQRLRRISGIRRALKRARFDVREGKG